MLRGVSMIFGLLFIAGCWALISGMPWTTVLQLFDKGVSSSFGITTTILIGAWLAGTLQVTGVAESLIRDSVELAGDRPFVVASAIMLVTGYLWMGTYGAGAVAMMGIIVLPIMMAAGIPKKVAAFAYMGIYGIMNTAMNPFIIKVIADIYYGGGPFGTVTVAGWINNIGIPMMIIGYGIMFAFIVYWVVIKKAAIKQSALNLNTITYAMKGGETVDTRKRVSKLSYLTPAIPVVLVIVFGAPIMGSLLVGTIYCILTTSRPEGRWKSWRQLIDDWLKGWYKGYPDTAFIALNMAAATMIATFMNGYEPLKALLGVSYGWIMPATTLMFLFLRGVLAPLGLYRGPIEPHGVGSVLTLQWVANVPFNPTFQMAMGQAANITYRSVDPTFSENVWTMGFVGTTAKEDLMTGLPWIWAFTILTCLYTYFMVPSAPFAV